MRGETFETGFVVLPPTLSFVQNFGVPAKNGLFWHKTYVERSLSGGKTRAISAAPFGPLSESRKISGGQSGPPRNCRSAKGNAMPVRV